MVLFQETRLYHCILCHLHWLIHLISPKSSSASDPSQTVSACVFCSSLTFLPSFFLTSYSSCFYSVVLWYCPSLLLMTNSDRSQVLSFLHLNISPSPVTHLIFTLNLPIYHFSVWWILKVVHLTLSLEPSDLSNECSIAFLFSFFFSSQSCYYIFTNLSSFFSLIALLNVFVTKGFAFFALLEEACMRCMCTRIMCYKNYVREILCFMFCHSSVWRWEKQKLVYADIYLD